jgi:tRNA-modifying protein YgfZ
MGTGTHDTREVEALERGLGFVRLDPLRAVRVTGADSVGWLQDLLTADVASLEPGRARRSLLLSPTGRIRADLQVVRDAESLWLLQTITQPEAIDRLLAPYVLSSDVTLRDTSADTEAVAIPSGPGAVPHPPASPPLVTSTPSILGDGTDVLAVGPEARATLPAALRSLGLVEAGPEAGELLRVRRGLPRMGADFEPGDLPSAAGLDGAVDHSKGCFLGQESVARVRNLGHPPSVLVRVRSDRHLPTGAPIRTGHEVVGRITSGGPDGAGLGRIAWEARAQELTLDDGSPLFPLPDLT